MATLPNWLLYQAVSDDTLRAKFEKAYGTTIPKAPIK